MTNFGAALCVTLALAATSSAALAQPPSSTPVPVTVDNYNRAQTDVDFAGVVKNGGFGQFRHGRELAPPAQQGIPRPNRDTLYSFAIVDLDAGPVTIAQGHGIWVKTLKGHSGCDIMRRCSAFGLCLDNRGPDDTPTPPGELPTAEATL